MRYIGLTGGIATGKSTVCTLMAKYPIHFIDADDIAHKTLSTSGLGYQDTISLFGQQILLPTGEINRVKLGSIIFNDSRKRHALEQIIHPLVINEIHQVMAQPHVSSVHALTVIDVPLLFETHMEILFNEIILVYLPLPLQCQRLQQRDHLSSKEAAIRINAQIPIDEKRPRAKWIFDNSGSLAQTQRQIDEWWQNEINRSQPA